MKREVMIDYDIASSFIEDDIVPVDAIVKVQSPYTILLLLAIGIGGLALAWFGYNKFLRKGGKA